MLEKLLKLLSNKDTKIFKINGELTKQGEKSIDTLYEVLFALKDLGIDVNIDNVDKMLDNVMKSY